MFLLYKIVQLLLIILLQLLHIILLLLLKPVSFVRIAVIQLHIFCSCCITVLLLLFAVFLSHSILTRLCICHCALDTHQCVPIEYHWAIVKQHREPFTYYCAPVTVQLLDIVLLLHIYILLLYIIASLLHTTAFLYMLLCFRYIFLEPRYM